MNQKGFAPILILISLLVLALIGGAVYYLYSQKTTTTSTTSILPSVQPKSTSVISIKPSSTPVDTPASLPQVVLYSSFTKSLDQNERLFYKDPILHLLFDYPKTFVMNSLPADIKNDNAKIYLLKEKNAELEQQIKDEINCDLGNRRNPSGVCAEGNLSDIDIVISFVTKIPYQNEDEKLNYQECQKELNNEKIVYSCTSIISASGSMGYTYNVYFPKGNKIAFMRLITSEAEPFKSEIKTIIDSFNFY